jgi:hypothetical protein
VHELEQIWLKICKELCGEMKRSLPTACISRASALGGLALFSIGDHSITEYPHHPIP